MQSYIESCMNECMYEVVPSTDLVDASDDRSLG